jgi:hypothetical protein
MKYLVGGEVREVAWWPPKVGDKLRILAHHSAGDMRIKTVLAPLHVVSVFEHDNGHTKACCAEWLPGRRRWKYEVYDILAADLGTIWPDGMEPPGEYNDHARELWHAKQVLDDE